MKLTDPVEVARAEYAAAVAPVLGEDPRMVALALDRELRQWERQP